jgi:hypothetical protein
VRSGSKADIILGKHNVCLVPHSSLRGTIIARSSAARSPNRAFDLFEDAQVPPREPLALSAVVCLFRFRAQRCPDRVRQLLSRNFQIRRVPNYC